MHFFGIIHLGPAAISKGYRPGRVSEEHEEEKHPLNQHSWESKGNPPNATPPQEDNKAQKDY